MRQFDSAVELWLVDLEKCAGPLQALEKSAGLLTVDDYKRANTIRDAGERDHRLTAYIAVRTLLERVAGPGVRRRRLVRSQSGKPKLDKGGAEFSLSHIDGLALIGVSSTSSLGVDLERTRSVRMEARRRSEILAVGRGLCQTPLPDLDRDGTFLQAWARLEAFAKVHGGGLAKALTAFGIRGRDRRQMPLADLEARSRQVADEVGVAVHDVALLPGLYGAVGSAPGVRAMRVRAFPASQASIRRLLTRPGPAGKHS